MKISELINALGPILHQQGDIEVTTINWMSGGWLAENAKSVKVVEARFGLPTLGGEKNHVIRGSLDRVEQKAAAELFDKPLHSVVVIR